MLTGRRADQLLECLLGTRCETIKISIFVFSLSLRPSTATLEWLAKMRGKAGSGKRLEHERLFVELERLLSLVMDAWMSRVHVVV